MMTAEIRVEWRVPGQKIHTSEVSGIMLNSEVISQIQEQIKEKGTDVQREQIEYSEENFSADFVVLGMKFLAVDP